MSSILPFVVVAASLAIVASVALGEAPQPATTGDGVRRDPWTDRLRVLLRRIVRGLQTVWSALLGRVARMAEARRQRRADRAADRPTPTETVEITTNDAPSAAADPPMTVVGPTSASSTPEGVLTTALMVTPDPALGDVAGERVSRAGPSLITRLRSALGLAALILVLGLTLAAVLGVIIAIVGGAIDGFVN